MKMCAYMKENLYRQAGMKKLLNLTSQNYKPKIVSDVKYSTALKATVKEQRKAKKSGALSNLQFLYSPIVLVESNKRERRVESGEKEWKI